MQTLLIAIRISLVTLLLTAGAYPLVVTVLAKAMFRDEANGSIVKDDQGNEVGSSLLGQQFAGAAYLQPRPSAAGGGYDASASGGSNLGSTSQKLKDRATADALRLQKENPGAGGAIPADLVTASASGLDPHVTPEAALWQVPRIAAARHLDPARVHAVVVDRVEVRDLGFLGEPRVNVLLVNLALDRQFGKPLDPVAHPAVSDEAGSP